MPQFESEFEQNLYRQRQEKLEGLTAIGQRLGLAPLESIYPNRFPAADESLTLANIPDLIAQYDGATAEVTAEQLEAERPTVAVAGRLMSLRVQGKAGFAHLQGGGKRLQIYVRKDDVGEDVFALYKLLDLGDHIGVRGMLMRTRTGELTLKALPLGGKPAISFLTKAMLALPDKYHGLEDVELRYRQRYVDLIMNSGTLAKAEAAPAVPTATALPAAPANPQLSSRSVAQGSAPDPATHASSRPELTQVSAVERPLYSGAPGISPVTENASSNEEHNDAPLNVREVFVKRAAILRAIRKFLDARGYLEVETPMLHTVAGGAAARPFSTHHNALDIPLSLRIAPELFLKRLVVGGLDRVYEINRNFRNEGVSTRHNPEFTMLEFYQAYANYHDLMDLTQEMIHFVAMEVNGTTETHFNSQLINLDAHSWTRLSMREAIIKFWPDRHQDLRPAMSAFDSVGNFIAWAERIDPDGKSEPFGGPPQLHDELEGAPAQENSQVLLKQLASVETRVLQAVAHQYRTLLIGQQSLGRVIANIFEEVAEPHLVQPTIIYDFPLAVSPLSKVKPDEPDWVERFEFYIGGFEVGNAFSELNDPTDQQRRFEAQVADKDPESMAAVDDDYVRALGYGLPPTAGEGIGIDRLTMLLTGSRSIRDVILFPLMRPRAGTTEPESHTHGQSAE